MQKTVIEANPQAGIKVYICWANVLVGDNDVAVAKASEIFTDPRVTQFHDASRRVSQQVGKHVKFPAMLDILEHLGKTQQELEANFQKDYITGPGSAFDMFLFFDRGAAMNPDLPEPLYWYTQMDAEVWKGMTPDHTFRGKVLEDQLKETMDKLFKPSLDPAAQPTAGKP